MLVKSPSHSLEPPDLSRLLPPVVAITQCHTDLANPAWREATSGVRCQPADGKRQLADALTHPSTTNALILNAYWRFVTP
eukprot:1119215-Pelagomonas_calceolata.AAC.3